MRAFLITLSAAAVLAGCGTTGSEGPRFEATPSATPRIGGDEDSLEQVTDRLQQLARRKDRARRAGDHETAERLEQAMRDLERAQDEALDAESGATPYDEAVDALPLREPPLYVEQLLLDDSHELVVRTRARRFFCGRTPRQRLAAVRAYYERAQSEMSARGIDDFALVVDGLRETGDIKALARGEAGKVSLTARGRGPGPC